MLLHCFPCPIGKNALRLRLGPEPRTKNPEPRTQNPEPRLQNPEAPYGASKPTTRGLHRRAAFTTHKQAGGSIPTHKQAGCIQTSSLAAAPQAISRRDLPFHRFQAGDVVALSAGDRAAEADDRVDGTLLDRGAAWLKVAVSGARVCGVERLIRLIRPNTPVRSLNS